jgi:DNA-binding NarL/FixJ family response regulator
MATAIAPDQSAVPVRVVLVDRQYLFRTGLCKVLEREGLEVVADVDSAAEALGTLAREHVDVILLDLNTPDVDGPDAVLALSTAAPRAQVIVLSASQEDEDVLGALVAGADGYLLKDEAIEEIVTGVVRAAVAGETLISPRIAAQVVTRLRELTPAHPTPQPDKLATPPELTEREQNVLALIVRGYDNGEIARQLYVSPSTVKRHIEALLDKLGVANRVQAAVSAVRNGLVE